MGMLIVGILAMLAISWLFNLLAKALPELCLFVYRFSGSLLLLFGYVCWQTTDYSSGKGGELFLQILLLSPFLMIGATDSRYFRGFSDAVLNFSAVQDVKGFHGIDERIGITDLNRMIYFYQQLIQDK